MQKRRILLFIFLSILIGIPVYASPKNDLTQLYGFVKGLNEDLENRESYSKEILFEKAVFAMEIFEETSNPKQTRCDALLVYSAITGLYSKREHDREYGKKSFTAIRDAVAFMPEYVKAVKIYSKALIKMSEWFWIPFAKMIIEGALDISHDSEVSKAIALCENLGLSEYVKKLKKLQEVYVPEETYEEI